MSRGFGISGLGVILVEQTTTPAEVSLEFTYPTERRLPVKEVSQVCLEDINGQRQVLELPISAIVSSSFR